MLFIDLFNRLGCLCTKNTSEVLLEEICSVERLGAVLLSSPPAGSIDLYKR